MPLHLLTDRRRFLMCCGGGAVACSLPTPARGEQVDASLVYLLNDTHIGEKHPPDSPVPSHLRQVVDELVGRPTKPAAVLINGDLALRDGQPGDYRHLAKLLRPLRAAGLALHLTLGNHDDRDVFYGMLREESRNDSPIQSRHIGIVETQHANFFLLDSLVRPMLTQGLIGGQQLKWLATALDARPERPAVIVTHHNPRLGGDPLHFPGGLIDSNQLWDMLAARRHVKAYIHGHIHDRSFAEHRGIHIINTPATSYVADRTKSTTGWTTAKFSPSGVVLTTHTNDPAHAWNGEQTELAWRS